MRTARCSFAAPRLRRSGAGMRLGRRRGRRSTSIATPTPPFCRAWSIATPITTASATGAWGTTSLRSQTSCSPSKPPATPARACTPASRRYARTGRRTSPCSDCVTPSRRGLWSVRGCVFAARRCPSSAGIWAISAARSPARTRRAPSRGVSSRWARTTSKSPPPGAARGRRSHCAPRSR